jgi:asparagine synthase (glutamine-hydrolysing)
MCGINAIFNSIWVSEEHISIVGNMNNEMLYRGPDAQVFWSNDNVVFGHNRLSIIGLENGNQPIFNKDITLALICNGEIYNYLELKAELEEEGVQFHTESDCEVILYLYEKMGTAFLSKLRGMFAFCLWDEANHHLLIARDRMGKKPLYYARGSKGIAISSEIKAITHHFLSSFSINELEVTNALKYSHPLDSHKTIINEVVKVEPGEFVIFKGDSIKKNKYWDINAIKKINSINNDYSNQTYSLLKESVDIRLRSDVPVGILLSSGIDSCSVAALAKQCREEVHAITVGYKSRGTSDERMVAQKFAKEKGIIYHEIELDQKDFENYFEEYTSVIDEPVCDIAAIAQWGIYKKAKELGFKVLLSGIGGDELFYGYQVHNQFGKNWSVNKEIKKFFPMNSWKGNIALAKYIVSNKKELNSYFKNNIEDHFTRYYKSSFESFLSSFENLDFALINKELSFNDSTKNGVENIYSFLLNEWLINNCFYQTDKLAMGNSVEVRAPFADHQLIEFVLSIPFDKLYFPTNPKGFLKNTMKNDLPDYILNLPKKGFTPPMDYVDNIVKKYNSKFFKSSIFDYNQVVTDKILSNYYGSNK